MATRPNDIVEFTINVSAYNFLGVSNVKVKDIIPNGFTYTNGSTKVDNIGVNDDIISGQGLSLGNITFGSPKVVKFLATVKASDQFPVGTTNLENIAQGTSDAGSREVRLPITVQKPEVLGTSTIKKVAGIKTGFDTVPLAVVGSLLAGNAYLFYVRAKVKRKEKPMSIIGKRRDFDFNVL